MFYHIVMDIQARKERNNKIINGILSAKSSVLLVCPTKPSALDFLPDLINNFGSCIICNMQWEVEGLAVSLYKNVLKENVRNELISLYRKNREKYRPVIVNEIIGNLKSGSLVFICGLDNLHSDDRDVLFLLMLSCPETVRIVFSSEVCPDFASALPAKMFPRVLSCEQDPPLSFDAETLQSGLSEEEKRFLSRISRCAYVDGEFVNTLYDGALDLLSHIAKNYRFAMLRTGNVFRFAPEFHDAFSEWDGDETDEEIYDKYLAYCLQKGDAEKCFYHALCLTRANYVEKAAEVLLQTAKMPFIIETLLLLPYPEENDSLKPILALLKWGKERSAALSDYPAPLKKIYYYRQLSSQKAHTLDEFCLEINTCNDDDFLQYAELNACLNYLERFELAKKTPFFERCKEALTRKDIASNPHYLDLILAAADVASILGRYDLGSAYLKTLRAAFPFFRFSEIRIWEYLLGNPFLTQNTEESDALPLCEPNAEKVFSVLTDLCHGQKKRAEKTLPPFSVSDCENLPTQAFRAALHSLLAAEIGWYEYAENIICFYIERCKINYAPVLPLLRSSLSFCRWLEGKKTEATAYASAQEPFQNSPNVFSFLSEGISLSRTLEEDKSETTLERVNNILLAAQNNGYGNLIAIFPRCFLTILATAEEKKIMSEYTARLRATIQNKTEKGAGTEPLYIRFFGNSTVLAGKKEIHWKTKRCKELFLLYQLFPEGIDRNRLLFLVWKEYEYNSAVNNLKTSNNLIRKTLAQYDIEFDFSYLSGKYKLTAKRAESDLDVYRRYIDSPTTDLKKRILEIDRLFGLCEEGFIADSDLPFFIEKRDKIQREIGLIILALIKDLMANGDYVAANRMVLRLEKIKYPDWEKIKTEIEKKVIGT